MYQKPTWSLVPPSLEDEWLAAGAASLSSLGFVWNAHWHLTGSWTTWQDCDTLRSFSNLEKKNRLTCRQHNFNGYAGNLFLVTIRMSMSIYVACPLLISPWYNIIMCVYYCHCQEYIVIILLSSSTWIFGISQINCAHAIRILPNHTSSSHPLSLKDRVWGSGVSRRYC